MSLRIFGFVGLLACAATASAQTSVDRSFTSTANDCGAITWSDRALELYPTIGSACQSVEERNGKKYVKFTGKLKSKEEGGKRIVVDFKDGGEFTLSPPPETTFYIDGRQKKVADLRRGDELNFYIAEDRLAAQFPETETQTARLVVVPIVQDVPEEPEQMTAALPRTASLVPTLGIAAFGVLALAALMRLFRKLQ
jgi:hypothetical protein